VTELAHDSRSGTRSDAAVESDRVIVVKHPLVESALVVLRDKDTPTDSFRRYARALVLMLAFRVLEHIPTRNASVVTPLETTSGLVLDRDVVFVPVLRAGLAMLDAMSDFVPDSRVGFVGLERDERTAIARHYYDKLPEQLSDAEVIVLDPMLATGGSALATIDLLQRRGAQRISLACVLAAPEGIAAVLDKAPDTRICTAVIDRELSDRKFILPGLGDFGDRYFATV
jgi:uracil phosphoribosyltransferase